MQETYCPDCRWAAACLPLADLKVLTLHRPALEADYGWDIVGFIGEAKNQYRTARAHGCPHLDAVRAQAQTLVPEVQLTQLD